MPLFRALAKNMAPMTNADESPTNRLTPPLSFIYLEKARQSFFSQTVEAKNMADF